MAKTRAKRSRVFSICSNTTSTALRRQGLFGFLRDNKIVPLALILGLLCTLSVIPGTVFLSRQTYECPSWAVNCVVYTQRIGTIQGAVTLLYTIGLTCIAYSCWALAEVSLWPLLCHQPLTLRQIDTYLAVCRGSIPSIPLALATTRKWDAFLTLTCAVLVTVGTLSAGPVVGYVFDQKPLRTEYNGQVSVGGGLTVPWMQRNPPVSSKISATAFYSDWTSNFTTNESMPEYRDWLIDRQTLSSRGNFTAHVVRIQKSIHCDGFSLHQTTGPSPNSSDDTPTIYFDTQMGYIANSDRTVKTSNSKIVAVTNLVKMSVWAHNVTFISPNRTIAKLVFAVPAGNLENGNITNLTGIPSQLSTNISAVACDIDIELRDDVLVVGDGGLSNPNKTGKGANLPVLSDLSTLYSANNRSHPRGTSSYSHKELALWFAASPIISGVSVEGNQPMFSPDAWSTSGNWTLRSDVSTTSGQATLADGTPVSKPQWYLGPVYKLIEVSIGAMGLAMSLSFRENNLDMKFTVFALRMDPRRNVLLAIPVIVMLFIWLTLAFWTMKLHRSRNIPIMRMGETMEILQACRDELRRGDESILLTNWDSIVLSYQRDATGIFALRSSNKHTAGDEQKQTSHHCKVSHSHSYDNKTNDDLEKSQTLVASSG